jgi:hypothetical protein
MHMIRKGQFAIDDADAMSSVRSGSTKTCCILNLC